MVLAVASAGWVFDVYEGQLFTIFKTPMLNELTGGDPAAIDWQGNLGLAAFLLGGAAGGLFFSVLGDRYGRVRMMAYTILVYSIFSALTVLRPIVDAGARASIPGGAGRRGRMGGRGGARGRDVPGSLSRRRLGYLSCVERPGHRARVTDRHVLRATPGRGDGRSSWDWPPLSWSCGFDSAFANPSAG